MTTTIQKLWKFALLPILILVMMVSRATAEETGKTPATRGEQPWMAGLVLSDEKDAYQGFICGASLIAPEWVLTAAHCLEGINQPSELDVIIGRYTLSSNEGERITAEDMIVHSGYINYEDGQDNDIALIKLSRPATEGTPIPVINATNAYVDDPNQLARVTGWGQLTESNEYSPDMLHGVDLPLVSQQTCRPFYGEELTPDGLCAGVPGGGKDSCYGDSGGPLVALDRNGNPVQVGIVSWGNACGENYGIYARLTEYEAWIAGVQNGTIEGIDSSDIPVEEDDWDDEDDWYEDGDDIESYYEEYIAGYAQGFEDAYAEWYSDSYYDDEYDDWDEYESDAYIDGYIDGYEDALDQIEMQDW